MVSFYTLPSTVMHHPVHRSIKAAYSYYNVAKKTKLVDLMRSALITARNVSILIIFYEFFEQLQDSKMCDINVGWIRCFQCFGFNGEQYIFRRFEIWYR